MIKLVINETTTLNNIVNLVERVNSEGDASLIVVIDGKENLNAIATTLADIKTLEATNVTEEGTETATFTGYVFDRAERRMSETATGANITVTLLKA